MLDLPEQYRTVIMLRDIEELSTAETAEALDLTDENVKIRLHRGHWMIRNWLFERIGAKAKEAFPFMGMRCDRVVQTVFNRLANCRPQTRKFTRQILPALRRPLPLPNLLRSRSRSHARSSRFR